MFRFDEKVVLITGAAAGIGRATAELFAKQGAKVGVTDINFELVEQVVMGIREKGGTAEAIKCDVTDLESINKTVDKILELWGDIDIFVSNAGGVGRVTENIVEKISDDDFEHVLRINLYAPFYFARRLVPIMREKRSGKIIMISSTAGRHNSRAEYGRIPYAAAKAGQLGLMRQLAKELGEYNIQINGLAPGQIASSEEQNHLWWTMNTDEQREAMLDKIPLRRRGEPEEVAAGILFLASQEASYVTGHCLDINGGYFMA